MALVCEKCKNEVTGSLWYCHSCNLKFCGYCATDYSNAAGNVECPNCKKWTSATTYSN
jgi:hypothetical protein